MKNMNRVHDLTGQKFGRLTVIGLDTSKETRKTYWICQCECGKISSHRSDGLLGGHIKSCGCYKSEQDALNVAKNHTHKQSGTRLYHIWQGMKERCHNQNSPNYKNWGARGIKVCEEWKNSFETFYQWAMENGYKSNLTIDRIDNNAGYNPQNCRWATNKEQCRNRRSNVYITIGKTTKTLKEWCEVFNLPYGTVNVRYHRLTASGNLNLDNLFKG